MTTSYTNLLGLALPVTGELTGTWGDTVNNYITEYLDEAVAGAQIISGSQTAVTLTAANGAALVQAGVNTAGSSQYAIISCIGNPASELTITAPAASKTYLILNNTSTNQPVKIVGAGPTTGVTVSAGNNALVAWNGTDFELIASTDVLTATNTATVTNKTISVDTNTISGIAASSFVLSNASGNIDGAVAQKAIPAGVVVGTTDTQVLTNKTLSGGSVSGTISGTATFSGALTYTGSATYTTATMRLPSPNGGDPPPTTEGLICWTTSTDRLTVGTGSTALEFVNVSSAQTLTNKRIDPRNLGGSSVSSVTPSIASSDFYFYNTLGVNITINAPTGTPQNGNRLMFRLKDDGTSRTITWNATYTPIGVTLPTATVPNKMIYVDCIYNSDFTRWDVILVAQQA